MSQVYCTTYCNFGHDVGSGDPVDHECHNIPPEALEAEMAGDFDTAIELLQGKKRKRKGRSQ